MRARHDPAYLASRMASVFQDGRTFYIGDDNLLEQTVSAPMRVSDFDTVAAQDARDWFVKVWCARNAISPQWEGETF